MRHYLIEFLPPALREVVYYDPCLWIKEATKVLSGRARPGTLYGSLQIGLKGTVREEKLKGKAVTLTHMRRVSMTHFPLGPAALVPPGGR